MVLIWHASVYGCTSGLGVSHGLRVLRRLRGQGLGRGGLGGLLQWDSRGSSVVNRATSGEVVRSGEGDILW